MGDRAADSGVAAVMDFSIGGMADWNACIALASPDLAVLGGLISGNHAGRIPVAGLGEVALIGRLGRDIDGAAVNGIPRGPFDRRPYRRNGAYPCLWGNDAGSQTRMMVEPDTTLEARPVQPANPGNSAASVWSTASRLHVNLQARYTSQRLLAAYTAEPTLGGSGWPNARAGEAHERALAAWLNSSFGVLLYLLHSGSQQRGRGRMSLTAFAAFPVLDVRALAPGQITGLGRLFGRMAMREMLPFNLLDRDPARQELDREILRILGADIGMELGDLYGMMVAEPQMHRPRPAGRRPE